MAEVQTFLQRLLIAIADSDERQAGVGYTNPHDAAVAAGLSPRGGWIAKAIPHFVANGWVRELPQLHGLSSGDRSYLIALTLDGLVEAERIRTGDRSDITGTPLTIFPAADRFVSRSDNEDAFNEAKAAVSQLAEAVQGAHDLVADPEERLAIVREIKSVSDLFDEAKIRVSAILLAVTENGIIRWLADRAASRLVADAAASAAAAITRLVGRGLPW